jgi:hypothetical protein
MVNRYDVRGKEALTGPEGSRRLCSHILRQSPHEGGKVVSPTHRPTLPQGHSAAERNISIKNSIETIGDRSRDRAVQDIMRKNTVDPGRPLMSIASWIPNAKKKKKHIHTPRIRNTHCFSTRTVAPTCLIVTLYVLFLSRPETIYNQQTHFLF